MSTSRHYDQWSATYDAVENKTRDLEKVSCEKVVASLSFSRVLELGAGTGKNTSWLAERADRVLSVDFSEEMQAIAKAKVTSGNVDFRLADIRESWDLDGFVPDLITCSLILEHVDDLDQVFASAYESLARGGHFYICELHPFKQYEGSKARFETEDGLQVTECFEHHVTDYTIAGQSNGFAIARIDEWFDDEDRTKRPRLISFVFTSSI